MHHGNHDCWESPASYARRRLKETGDYISCTEKAIYGRGFTTKGEVAETLDGVVPAGVSSVLQFRSTALSRDKIGLHIANMTVVSTNEKIECDIELTNALSERAANIEMQRRSAAHAAEDSTEKQRDKGSDTDAEASPGKALDVKGSAYEKLKSRLLKEAEFEKSMPPNIVRELPTKSLLRCFSKYGISHNNLTEDQIRSIYKTWRNYEANKRRDLRALSSAQQATKSPPASDS